MAIANHARRARRRGWRTTCRHVFVAGRCASCGASEARVRVGREAQARGKAMEATGLQLLRSIGAVVYNLGTTRRAGDYQGTMQTPGPSDKRIHFPARGGRSARAVWWESKAGEATLSQPQRAFVESERAAGETVIVGDIDALIAWLVVEQYLRADQVAHFHAGEVTR